MLKVFFFLLFGGHYNRSPPSFAFRRFAAGPAISRYKTQSKHIIIPSVVHLLAKCACAALFKNTPLNLKSAKAVLRPHTYLILPANCCDHFLLVLSRAASRFVSLQYKAYVRGNVNSNR